MKKNINNAKVYLAGAGPGDPSLITAKTLHLITTADVILHDNLIPHELLSLAKPDAQIISVAKSAKKHTLPQEKINSTIIKKAKQNKSVLRLKGGDPYLFGRGAEEALACEQAGIDFDSLDGKPVKIIIMIASSDKQRDEFLKVLAKVVLLFKEGSFRRKVLKAGTPDEVIALLKP